MDWFSGISTLGYLMPNPVFRYILNTACLKIDATINNSYCVKSFFIWVLKSNHITSERSNQIPRAEIDWLYPTVHMKDQVIGNVFRGTFLDSFQQNLSPHPHCQNFCSHFPTWSRIFCFLVEVVYWPRGLKFVYPTINLAFLGIMV